MTCNAYCDIDMGVFYEPPRNGPTPMGIGKCPTNIKANAKG